MELFVVNFAVLPINGKEYCAVYGNAVFAVNDAIHIVKAIEDYFGDGSRVQHIDIQPCHDFLPCTAEVERGLDKAIANLSREVVDLGLTLGRKPQ